MNEIIQLIQIAIGKKEGYDGVITPDTVRMWLSEAKKQSLIGVLTPAVSKLLKGSDNFAQLKQPLFNWMANSLKVEDRNRKMNMRTVEVSELMKSNGIDTCVLKGQGTASLYPNPLWRVCGDIDLWVRGDRHRIMEQLSSIGAVGKTVYYHTEMTCFGDTEVEVHFHPTWFNDPFVNRKFKIWLRSVEEEQFCRDSGLGFSCPTVAFNLVYSFLHIFKHVFSEGVGLRQMMDYYYIVCHSNADEREKAARTLRSFGLGRMLGGVTFVMKEVFLLDGEYLMAEPSEKFGKPLLAQTLRGGNFGKSDPRNVHGKETLLEAGFRKIKISLNTISLCPGEVLWLPVYKIWHLFWRKINTQ